MVDPHRLATIIDANESILQRMNQILSALPQSSCKKSNHTMVDDTANVVFEVGVLEKDWQLDKKCLTLTTNKRNVGLNMHFCLGTR